jgi:hypothetical protein
VKARRVFISTLFHRRRTARCADRHVMQISCNVVIIHRFSFRSHTCKEDHTSRDRQTRNIDANFQPMDSCSGTFMTS